LLSVKTDAEVLAKLGIDGRRGTRRWLVRVVVLLAAPALAVGGSYVWRAHDAQGKRMRWIGAPVAKTDLSETQRTLSTVQLEQFAQNGETICNRPLIIR
jgi:hypothetical protein